MIIRTIDDKFVNLNNVAKVEFNFKAADPIEIKYPFREEGEDLYDVDYPLGDVFIGETDLAKIRDWFIEALEKNKPYFDFRDAYINIFDSSAEKIDAMECIERIYGEKNN